MQTNYLSQFQLLVLFIYVQYWILYLKITYNENKVIKKIFYKYNENNKKKLEEGEEKEKRDTS